MAAVTSATEAVDGRDGVVFLTASGEETSDEAAAPKTPDGRPVENGLRNLWVTETALSSALNMESFSVLVLLARPHEAGAS
jgi:hypothetical protein